MVSIFNIIIVRHNIPLVLMSFSFRFQKSTKNVIKFSKLKNAFFDVMFVLILCIFWRCYQCKSSFRKIDSIQLEKFTLNSLLKMWSLMATITEKTNTKLQQFLQRAIIETIFECLSTLSWIRTDIAHFYVQFQHFECTSAADRKISPVSVISHVWI